MVNPRLITPCRFAMSAMSILFALFALSCAPSRPADLVVFGRIWTGASAAPGAQAVATRGDTIIGVGDSAEIARYAGEGTRILSNGKALVTPGFRDGHGQCLDGGYQLASVDLRGADRPAEFITRLKNFAAERRPGEWIL